MEPHSLNKYSHCIIFKFSEETRKVIEKLFNEIMARNLSILGKYIHPDPGNVQVYK
jgi:effector-binding domain-containing protein